MNKLEELLDTFRNDKHWNTENRDGSHRFDEKLLWIESMIKDYAEKLKMSIDTVVERMEEKRDYSWPNYYQEGNFPPMDSDRMIRVFETTEAFINHVKENYIGFKCSACGTIGKDPQECEHRIKKDDICNWTSYGLFHSLKSVVILDKRIQPICIFEPVGKEEFVLSPTDSVYKMDIPRKALNQLLRGGLKTVGHVANMTRGELCTVSGIGDKTAKRIYECLIKYGVQSKETYE